MIHYLNYTNEYFVYVLSGFMIFVLKLPFPLVLYLLQSWTSFFMKIKT